MVTSFDHCAYVQSDSPGEHDWAPIYIPYTALALTHRDPQHQQYPGLDQSINIYSTTPSCYSNILERFARLPSGMENCSSKMHADSIYVRNQQESPLLRLPSELRLIIYEHALGGHIWNVRTQRNGDHSAPSATNTTATDPITKVTNPNIDALHLVQTCRQIYHEAKFSPVRLSTFNGSTAVVSKLFLRTAPAPPIVGQQ